MKGIGSLLVGLLLMQSVVAQTAQTLNLPALQRQGQLPIVNRDVSPVGRADSSFIRLSETNGEGLVWVPVSTSVNSIVEIEMRGKDVFQRSCIGVAFNGLNDTTYEAVYCRPFNFFAADSIRRIHAIQYVAHPAFTWKKLRESQNGLFEKPIPNAPNPNNWFIMKVVIREKTIEAYINDAAQPALVVNRLSNQAGNKLGLFVGDGSGGDFRRITVTPVR